MKQEERYPDYKLAFYKRCTEAYAAEFLGSIKEFFAWFTSLLESRIQ
jgi:hypothetical protein